MTHELVSGDCDTHFRHVQEVFIELVSSEREIGAAVAVTLHGKPIIDLWGGYVDRKHSAPWQKDTLVNVFSTTKGITALCALRMVEAGLLDLDQPVARYWPEFARNGKDQIPVRYLLNHKAGLPAVRKSLPNEALYEWETMCDALAAEEPWWTPGERHGYHAVTFGWLVGELIRRVSGKRVGQYVREELAGPLDLDFFIGLSEQDLPRVARISQSKTPPDDAYALDLMQEIMNNPTGMTGRAFANPLSIATGTNTDDWRRAEIPSANGHSTARSLARLYGALACGGELDGVHVLGRDMLPLCFTETARGEDLVLKTESRFSLGFMLSLDREGARFGPNARSFGHPGAGGSVGFADPESGLGFGYVMNCMGPYFPLDPRSTELIDAVYACLR